MDKIKVIIGGEEKEYEKGITLFEISRDFAASCDNDIILAFVNGKLRELFKTVSEDCTIRFITTNEDVGFKTYSRGMILLLLKAIYEEFRLTEQTVEQVFVEYAIGNGIYCEAVGNITLTNEAILSIKNRMLEMVKKDIPFEKRSVGTDEAIELFKKHKMYDKVKLFKYRRVSKANIYNLGNFEDYYYGYMPPSTGYLKYFDLMLYEGGIMLLLPSRRNPKVVKELVDRKNLFYTLRESNRWGQMMEVDTVGALNDVIAQGRLKELILVQEALQEQKLAEIAANIKKKEDTKFVMIAGPSSSGKTTFSHRLSIQLQTLGLKPHPIGVDDYFVDREKTPLDEDGKYNFESLYAIDLETLNRDMTDLMNGKRVELPSFNFKTGKREYKGNFKQLGKEDILVIEGIHGLNDQLTRSLPRESKFKIYISALTQLNIDEHNRIPTTDGRLIRRMIRDARTRGTDARRTIAMWPSVRRGEEENIFPFQEDADMMFNSALIYELAVLKQYAEPILFGIDRDCEEYIEAKRLLKFFDYFIGAPSEGIPINSILREFIGGSCFHV